MSGRMRCRGSAPRSVGSASAAMRTTGLSHGFASRSAPRWSSSVGACAAPPPGGPSTPAAA
eukprot:364946-Chlamydomonas_euryale.AAC.1